MICLYFLCCCLLLLHSWNFHQYSNNLSPSCDGNFRHLLLAIQYLISWYKESSNSLGKASHFWYSNYNEMYALSIQKTLWIKISNSRLCIAFRPTEVIFLLTMLSAWQSAPLDFPLLLFLEQDLFFLLRLLLLLAWLHLASSISDNRGIFTF